MRVRQERIQVEDQKPAEQTQSRQRYRARLAVVSQVTPTVEAGIRLASGNNNDVRSTNQDMNNYFTKKDIWLDRAYINWHPENVPGLKMIGGRMAQPWTKVAESEVIWDNDINPEGVAAQYSRKFGDTNVFGSMRRIHAERQRHRLRPRVHTTTCACTTGSSARTCFRARTSR